MYASVSVTPFGMSFASSSIATTGSYSSRNHASATSWRDIGCLPGLDHPEAPGLDRLGQGRVGPLVAQVDALARLGGQRHAVVEEPLVALQRQVAHADLVVRADLR